MKTWTMPAKVLSEHDGDTFQAELDVLGKFFLRWDIRVDGCDAPEISTDPGKAALAWLGTVLVIGEPIVLSFHGLEKYGRILGKVTLADGSDLTTLAIETGHAVAYHGENRNARLVAAKLAQAKADAGVTAGSGSLPTSPAESPGR